MSIPLSREEIILRRTRIPEPILRIAMNNPLIYRIKEMFISGQIITLDEMLCQMVVQLSVNWEEQCKEYERLILMTTQPLIRPKP